MVQLGSLQTVTSDMIEAMSPEDRNYLRDLYDRIHAEGGA